MCGTVDIERFTSVDEEVMLVALDNCWVGFDLVGFFDRAVRGGESDRLMKSACVCADILVR
jgi:hypothetical protein